MLYVQTNCSEHELFDPNSWHGRQQNRNQLRPKASKVAEGALALQ